MTRYFQSKFLADHIAPRMVAWTLLCGLIGTLVMTLIQISFDYNSGVKEIEETMTRIEATIKTPIANDVWEVNRQNLQTFAQGMLNHPEIERFEIRALDGTSEPIVAGKAPKEDFIVHKFQVHSPRHRSPTNVSQGDAALAEVTMIASTKNLRSAIVRRTVVILLTQGFKALLMSLMIYYFMNAEILDPLKKLAEHIKDLSSTEKVLPYKIPRFLHNNGHDEINRLCEAINSMDSTVKESYDLLRNELIRKKEMQAKVVQMAHEAGITEAATGVLHDVANLLNGTLLFVEQLKATSKGTTDLALRARFEDIINKLEKRVILIGQIIKAQQNMAGMALGIEQVNVDEIINDAIILEEWQNKKQDIRVARNVSTESRIKISRPQLVSVLVNLLKNARESIIQANQDSGLITISVTENDKFCEVKVTDNGMGAKPETLAKIFQRGFTTKSTGHGFGLAASSNIVQTFGGEMNISSPGEGRGATVLIRLPLAQFAPDQLPLAVQSIEKSA
jgi:signal transduction histidine kinase